jgi:hypothetical protein
MGFSWTHWGKRCHLSTVKQYWVKFELDTATITCLITVSVCHCIHKDILCMCIIPTLSETWDSAREFQAIFENSFSSVVVVPGVGVISDFLVSRPTWGWAQRIFHWAFEQHEKIQVACALDLAYVTPNVVVGVNTLLRIREVPVSDLGLETGYSDCGFSWFSSVTPGEYSDST